LRQASASPGLPDTPARPADGGAGEARIRPLAAGEEARWDAYVEACPQATFFHRAGWREAIRRTFGHRTWYLQAERDGRLVGVLPLGRVRSLLFGDALISTPFCVYGGIAADDADAAAALAAAGRSLADELGVDYLELRHRLPRGDAPPQKELYVGFRKPIDPDPDVNLKAIPRKQRAMVRKGMQAGLASEIDAAVDRFYAAYSESVRNLGTPVMPRAWFASLKQVFGDDCEVMSVTSGGTVVASVMSFYFRDEVLPYYGGGPPAARNLKANDFMYWELMRRACLRGVRVFDYGRSKRGAGSYHFKRNWGFEPEPLHYEYHLVKAREIPDVSPTNRKYRLMVRAWQRLPLGVTRAVGPLIARYLG